MSLNVFGQLTIRVCRNWVWVAKTTDIHFGPHIAVLGHDVERRPTALILRFRVRDQEMPPLWSDMRCGGSPNPAVSDRIRQSRSGPLQRQ